MHLGKLLRYTGEYDFNQKDSDDDITKEKYVMVTETNVETDGDRLRPLVLQIQAYQNPGPMVEGHSGQNNSEYWDHSDDLQFPKINNDENVLAFDNRLKGQQQKCPERYSDMLLRKESFAICKHLAAYNSPAMSYLLAETGLFYEG